MDSVFDRKEDCCGCTACKNICPTSAIRMSSDEEGFLYPIIDQKACIDCGLCRAVCVFQNGYNTDKNLKPPEVYAVKHKSEAVRMVSSSGGAFTAISDYMLSLGGVVFGAAFDQDFSVKHLRAENAEERDAFRGSKYVQSELRGVFKEIKTLLQEERNILFSGTGCQVSGLKSYLQKAHVNTERLLTVDLLCHGTPSPKLWSDYMSFIQKKEKVKSYTFRFKGIGWHGYNVKAIYASGKVRINNTKEKTFLNLFGLNLVLRPSCYQCIYKNTDRASDIMIGDFWGIEKTLPQFYDNIGVSLLFCNTAKGKDVFEEVSENVSYKASNINDCMQSNLMGPTKVPIRRNQFWIDYSENGFGYVAKKYAGYNIKSMTKGSIISALKKIGVKEVLNRLRARKYQ